jgi:hypothetical protein
MWNNHYTWCKWRYYYTTPKTAGFTAVSGNGYFVNTTSGAITVTLPAGSAGDIVGISDYASTFQTNNVTITPNGSDNINGVNDDATLLTQGIAVSLVYVDATRGWKSVTGSDNDTTGIPPFIVATGGTITCCGDYKIHTFTGPGTFTVTNTAICAADNAVDYLIIGGGGAGHTGTNGTGGGGAGGYRETPGTATGSYTAQAQGGVAAVTITAQGYPIVVGGGGTAPAGDGSVSSVFGSTSAGGGGGGAFNAVGRPGASGGGGGGRGNYAGGAGNTPPTSPAQGFAGGNSKPETTPTFDSGGGGGGATAVGANAANDPAPGGVGGAGGTSSINGTPTTRAGGGGGSRESFAGGAGGAGGGGAGGTNTAPFGPTIGVAGTVNTGSGGGGGCSPAGAGGSGIVIIRYKFQ